MLLVISIFEFLHSIFSKFYWLVCAFYVDSLANLLPITPFIETIESIRKQDNNKIEVHDVFKSGLEFNNGFEDD